jgi:hypothetical protein
VIPDHDEVDVAPAADQDADLAVGLPGDLAELPGKLEGEHPVNGDFAAVELLDAPDLAGLESGRVAMDAVDGERTSGCPGLWLKAKGLGPERRNGSIKMPHALSLPPNACLI